MADTYYYDLLGIPPHASDVEVKKGYRIQALLTHPDKNNGNGDANKKFQEIAEAYRVLSDPHLRAHYDRVGREGVERKDGPNAADASEMFSKMFSGESFQDWVGDNTILQDILTLSELHNTHGVESSEHTTTIDSSHLISNADLDTGASYGQFDHRQHRQAQKRKRDAAKQASVKRFQEDSARKRKHRILHVAEKLSSRLDEFPDDEEDQRQFFKNIEREAEMLKLESFGVYILNTIGEVYTSKAEEHGWYSSSVGYLTCPFYYSRDKITSAKHTATAVWGLLDAQQAVREAKLDELDKTEADRIRAERGAEEQELLEKIAAGKLLMSCWGLVRKDLISVLRNACDRVLYDEGVSYDDQKIRASALMTIGRIFQAARRDPNDQLAEGLFEKIVSDSYELSKKRKAEKRKSGLSRVRAPPEDNEDMAF